MKRVTTAILALVGILLAGSHHVRASEQEISTHIIVPGVRVGDYTFDMSKDEVLKRLGKPKAIFFGGETYTLDNLPRRYLMLFGGISFGMDDDAVTGIGVHSPLYKFANGLGVGDSEQKIKQAFGDDFHLEETEGKDFLIYEDKGLQLEIPKKNRTVLEIAGNRTTGDHDESTVAVTPSALEAFENAGIILIAGGYDKGIGFDELGSKVAEKARAAILIGESAEKIAAAIRAKPANKVQIVFAKSLAEAVKSASDTAVSGDIVLLSPACASYDMFENYQQRGQQFIDVVREVIR